jgi:hypothetical protein
MAKIRTIDLTARECPCGGVARPARRYEATRIVKILCCWTCGAETPPLYERPAEPVRASCRYCGERFVMTDSRQRYCSDDHRDRAGRIHLDRHSDGQRMKARRTA